MPIDVYSTCPGGTGKKIKFCCTDLLAELQKIERMLEGGQFQACLGHINRLEEKTPSRACLFATKAVILRELQQWDEAKANAAAFLATHPENPIALAESALVTAVTEGGVAALEPLQKALAVSNKGLEHRVYDTVGLVAHQLALEGNYLASRALFGLQAGIDRKDERALAAAMDLNEARNVPLFVKEFQKLEFPPADAPWKKEFEQAMTPAKTGCWGQAAGTLAALAEKVGNSPILWRDLAMLRGWSADAAGCTEALRKFAALDVPLEDASEAEALAAYLTPDALGDGTDLWSLEYRVGDIEQLQVALSSSPYVAAQRVDPSSLVAEGEMPPRGTYMICDRAAQPMQAELTIEHVQRVVGQLFLFGRETDRDARLEVEGVESRDLEQVKARLAELAGTELGEAVKQELTGRISHTLAMLRHAWRVPGGASPGQIRRLTRTHDEDFLFHQWPKLPLGLLNGKTPEEATADWKLRARVLGAILILEFWLNDNHEAVDLGELRSRLGLPVLEAIDPEKIPIRQTPLPRLHRVRAEKLDDKSLLAGFHVAVRFHAAAAMRSFAQAIADRPSLAARPERINALGVLAQTDRDRGQSLQHIAAGRTAARAASQSCAAWDLMELGIRITGSEERDVQRLLQHVQQQHAAEPGVNEALVRMLMDLGLIGPDGRFMAGGAPPPPAEPAIVVPGAESAKPGALWVPGSQTPAGEKPNIWTPGMD